MPPTLRSLLAWLGAGFGLYLVLGENYLLFHSLAEFFSVAVACGSFFIAWNTRRLTENRFLSFLGAAFFCIALIDLLHTLSYKGMGVFPQAGANLPTELWIGSRYLLGLSLLVGPRLARTRLTPAGFFAGFFLVAAGFLGAVFTGVFPDCYREGVGLTPFKVVSEYVISAIFLAAAVRQFRREDDLAPQVRRDLLVAMGLSVCAEMMFTAYVGVYDLANALGHVFKVASYGFIYQALVRTCLKEPYETLFRDLKQREEELARSKNRLEAAVWRRTEELARANAELRQEVDRRAQAQEELGLLAERLKRSNRDLDEFAAAASHDLQEPLRKILLFGDRLRETAGERLDEECQDCLDRMQRAARRMRALIEALLSYARLSTDGEARGSVDLGEILREVQGDLAARLAETGGRIEAGTLPVVEGTPLQMRLLLQNLVGNALKYHKPGQPPVASVRELDRTGAGKCAVVVEDNGIGFDERYLDRIFQPFQRLHGRNAYPGTGMGLAIVRKIVERHGGTITAKSAPGQGAAFIVELPCRRGERDAGEAEGGGAGEEPGRG